VECVSGAGAETVGRNHSLIYMTLIRYQQTAASLSAFMLAMRLYPNVMKKGQVEIDSVVGRDRLPTFEDWDNLPYIRAIVKEVLRWRPVAPLGVPRRTTKVSSSVSVSLLTSCMKRIWTQDDVYEGYFIPKGTIVLANIWAMNRDPALFPDYEEFRPERFLDESGTVEVVPRDTHNQGHVSFGFGRR
jgi:cytochrome P450